MRDVLEVDQLDAGLYVDVVEGDRGPPRPQLSEVHPEVRNSVGDAATELGVDDVGEHHPHTPHTVDVVQLDLERLELNEAEVLQVDHVLAEIVQVQVNPHVLTPPQHDVADLLSRGSSAGEVVDPAGEDVTEPLKTKCGSCSKITFNLNFSFCLSALTMDDIIRIAH